MTPEEQADAVFSAGVGGAFDDRYAGWCACTTRHGETKEVLFGLLDEIERLLGARPTNGPLCLAAAVEGMFRSADGDRDRDLPYPELLQVWRTGSPIGDVVGEMFEEGNDA